MLACSQVACGKLVPLNGSDVNDGGGAGSGAARRDASPPSVVAPDSSVAANAVLFGGYNVGGYHETSYLADTWTWNGIAWTQVDVTGPPARFNAVMASLNGNVVLFGGEDGDGEELSDTWVWDGTSWMERNAAGPPGREGAVMAALNGRLVL